jgi:hypothetical protein
MPAIKKIDFKKDDKKLYNPSKDEVTLVTVPKMNFLMINGQGNPNTSKEYQQAIEALYGVSYTIKFTLKFAKRGPQYTVPPFETLWWMPDGKPFTMENKETWLWQAMIRQPEHVKKADITDAITKASERKPNPAFAKIRFESFEEGLCVQIMHIGPYSEEGPTIAKMDAYIKENGYEFRGEHHEIYLSDPGRTAPEKLKTVVRHPVKKK